MKMMTRLLALVMALVMALLLCVPALAETAGSPDDVLATVNGAEVTRAEFDMYYANLDSYYTSAGYDMTGDEMVGLLKMMAMETAVEYELMDQKIVELGLSLSDEEKADATQAAREEWAAVIEDGMAYYGITAESTEDDRAAMLVQILAELESMGYTEEAYIEDSITFAAYDKLQAEVLKDVAVSDEDVKAYFDELVAADEAAYKNDAAAYEEAQYMNQMYLMYGMTDYYTDLYYMPEGYRGMSHILLNVDETLMTAYTDLQATFEEQQTALEEGAEVTGDLVTAEAVEEARLAIIASVQPTIDEIMGKLEAGELFADLIPQYTQDPGMTDAAAIAEGYEVHMDSIMWDPAFRDASFTVDNVGDVTEPVVGSYGVHILQYVRDIPAGPVELTADLMETLRSTLLASEQSTAYYAELEAWKEAADIVYSDEAAAFMATAE